MPKRKTNMKSMSLRLDKQTRDKLTDLAAQNGISRGEVMRQLINNADEVTLSTLVKQAPDKIKKENSKWAMERYIAYILRQVNYYQSAINNNMYIMFNKPKYINQQNVKLLLKQTEHAGDMVKMVNNLISKAFKIKADRKRKTKPSLKKKVRL